MLKADLHVHSTVSDGSESMEAIVCLAEAKGLDAVVFTEHDTLTHLERLPQSAKIQVMGGIEISAMDPERGTRAHILGYNLRHPDRVAAFTQPLLEERNRNTEKQADILRRLGYAIDPDALLRADGRYLYKQHVLAHLVETGQVPEMFGEFYQRMFKQNEICDFDIKYLNVYQAVQAIVQAGGQAVLAHSGQQQNFYLIPLLVKCGLAGLELNHPANSPDDRNLIQRYANTYGLFLTGGSDYHGRFEAQESDVGACLADESGVHAVCWA